MLFVKSSLKFILVLYAAYVERNGLGIEKRIGNCWIFNTFVGFSSYCSQNSISSHLIDYNKDFDHKIEQLEKSIHP